MRSLSTIILMLLMLISCRQEFCRVTDLPDLEKADLTVIHKEQELFDLEEVEEIMLFLEKNPLISSRFFYEEEYPDLEILARRVKGVIGDPYIDTLYRESVEAFENNKEELLQELGMAFSRMNYLFPQKQIPQIQTLVAGLYNDIIIDNGTIVLGIDFFVGEDASFRPADYPNYILRRYSYEYLAPTLVKFYVNDLDVLGEENTMLSEMIDHGKMYYLIGQLMPCVEDFRILGYTAEEMVDVKANQEIIWAHFIENQLLYETGEFTKRKYLGERPNIYEIGEKCPGRIGAWIGWEIVKNYMENSDVSVQDLLKQSNHHEIFTSSGYKPRNIR